jgi:hypothetical protein
MSECKTYQTFLYLGARVGYDGPEITEADVIGVISEFQKDYFARVPARVTKTTFVSGDYIESGWEIAVLAYPDYYPHSESVVSGFAYYLALHLKKKFQQQKLPVIRPGSTTIY